MSAENGGPSTSGKSSKRKNVGSKLLDKRENRRVFEALGSDCKSLCSGLARLFTVEPRIGWDQLLFGVVCWVRDFRHRKTSICIVSPGDFDLTDHEIPHVLIEISISSDVEFRLLAEDFIVFETENVGYGIEFVDENEATAFFQKVEFSQNVRRQNAQQEEDETDEFVLTSSTESTSHSDSTHRFASKRPSGQISLIFPRPVSAHRKAPIEFPPPPMNPRKPQKDLRCSFHRRNAIQPPCPNPPIRIAKFSAQKFVESDSTQRESGMKGRKSYFRRGLNMLN